MGAFALFCKKFFSTEALTHQGKILMYVKEASNRRQEIDRQHHTIPNQRNQRTKDKLTMKH